MLTIYCQFTSSQLTLHYMHTAFRIALLQLSIVNRRKACHSHTSLESTAAYMISIQPLNVAYVERVFSEYQHVKLNALIHYGFALNYLCVLWCKKRKGHENIFTVCKYALTDAYIFLMSQSCGSFFNVTLLSSEFQFFFFIVYQAFFPVKRSSKIWFLMIQVWLFMAACASYTV